MAPGQLQGLELCPLWPHPGRPFSERLLSREGSEAAWAGKGGCLEEAARTPPHEGGGHSCGYRWRVGEGGVRAAGSWRRLHMLSRGCR